MLTGVAVPSVRKCYSFLIGRRFHCVLEHCCYNHNTGKNYAVTSRKDHTGTNVDSDSSLCYLHFKNGFSDDLKMRVAQNMIVIEDFVTEGEEKSLFEEVEPYMKRLRYEFDHWDDAIHGYRETERSNWNAANSVIIQRVREAAFPPGTPQLSLVHVLDLAEDGFIKAHVDSVRFCGNTIAGLSLLSDCVMRLVHTEDKSAIVDVLLRRRSLYIMKDIARYDFTHEVLGKKNSKFRNQEIVRGRRLSVICRNEPEPTKK
ncbi:alpha-ketoglutarate-dependent dioxygenase alkB homolog 7, mitochondrial isoform X1 [Schistocerca americana]|uniref:alpha-ketoglutarate-dependent dioxygenase alkB homolog 7, mitochondrial isoform X1 n=1 Tax=Schistocerca americana TaxID=7009 RepID=UPI001F50324B|nr:alpha-ketoglutarate-dependent dioxygenase alkB homolog 7, mitochondrial isoform X1 [Schistocerca americana]